MIGERLCAGTGRRLARWTAYTLLALLLGVAGGCAELGYVAQAVDGHLAMLRAARPVTDWIADPATPEALRARLLLAQRLRDFAVSELHLPDNASYRRYADLHRSAVVWNVVAAPELSLTLKTWCWPIFGCAGYRGYFGRAAAEREAAQLGEQGWEVWVYGVPAYSTLGWSNWLGGDPLLNTFLFDPQADLARLIFHELAHQVAYARGDTAFNESFANAVARVGLRRWEQATGRRVEDPVVQGRRRDFRRLTGSARDELLRLYASELTDDAKRARKAQIYARMRAAYAALKAGPWRGYSGWDAWFAGADNASLALLGAYDELVPAFERLLARDGGDFSRWYADVRRLAALPPAQRRAALEPP